MRWHDHLQFRADVAKNLLYVTIGNEQKGDVSSSRLLRHFYCVAPLFLYTVQAGAKLKGELVKVVN